MSLIELAAEFEEPHPIATILNDIAYYERRDVPTGSMPYVGVTIEDIQMRSLVFTRLKACDLTAGIDAHSVWVDFSGEDSCRVRAALTRVNATPQRVISAYVAKIRAAKKFDEDDAMRRLATGCATPNIDGTITVRVIAMQDFCDWIRSKTQFEVVSRMAEESLVVLRVRAV